jgi:hypothetical protein
MMVVALSVMDKKQLQSVPLGHGAGVCVFSVVR